MVLYGLWQWNHETRLLHPGARCSPMRGLECGVQLLWYLRWTCALDLPGGTSLGTAFLEQGSLLDSGRVEESHSVRSIPLCAGYKTCTVFFFFQNTFAVAYRWALWVQICVLQDRLLILLMFTKTSIQESCAFLLQMGLSIHGAVISLQVAINIP
jgi:hypothetical protein